MSKIESLTADQEIARRKFRADWFRIGTCTEPADRVRAEAALRAMYEAAGHPAPKVIWAGGPATAVLLRRLLLDLAERGGDKALRDSLGASLGASLGDSLWASLRASLGDSLWASLRDSLRDSLRASLWDSLWDSLGDSLGDSLWDSLGASLRASLGDSLGASLRADINRMWIGQEAAYWVAFYAFPEDHLGVKYATDASRKLVLWRNVCASCGWFMPLDGVVIACERPEIIAMDDREVIHAESGPAIRCRDGFEVYAWHGVRVPKEVILEPQTLTVARIGQEKNAEVKRIMIERRGVGEYLREADAKLVDMDASPVPGGAPRCLLRTADGMQWLVGTDGSTERVYHMSVPEDAQTCRDAHCAIAGIDESKIIVEC